MAGQKKESSAAADDPLDLEGGSAEAAPEHRDDPAAASAGPDAEAEEPTAPPGAPPPVASATSAATPVEVAGPAPTVQLVGLGLRGARGWAFRDIDLLAHPGELVVITGPSGSGRSALLLTIAGRLRPTTGSLQVAGTSLAAGRRGHRLLRQVRERVAVARIAGHIGLDGDISVQINARDAADWAGRRAADVQDRLEEWRGRSGLTLQPRVPVAELSALESTALHLLLAAAVEPEVLVLDDADAALTPNEREQLWQLAAAVAATGPAVIATATDAPPEADVHLTLHRHGGTAADLAAPLPGEERSEEPADEPDVPTVPSGAEPPPAPEEVETPPAPELVDTSLEPEEVDTSLEPEEAGQPDAPDRARPGEPDQPGTDRDGAQK